MRILIVDDHAVVRRGLIEILAEGFPEAVFAEAENAGEALQQIRKQDWDLAVLGISLPGRSGLDVLKDARSARPRLPVLVLSIHPEDQYGLRVLKAGASGYLTKETAPEKLVEAARTILSGQKYVTNTLAQKLALRLESEFEGPPHERLSDREYQVMTLIALGKRVSQIAEELFLSVKTVSTYRARVLEKMGVKTNAEVIRYVIENHLE